MKAPISSMICMGGGFPASVFWSCLCISMKRMVVSQR